MALTHDRLKSCKHRVAFALSLNNTVKSVDEQTPRTSPEAAALAGNHNATFVFLILGFFGFLRVLRRPPGGNVYKPFWTIGLLLLGLIMAGCGSGSGSNSGNINGNWKASLTNTDGTPAYAFSTAFTQNGDGTVSVTNFSFTSAGSCFDSQSTNETGSFALTGNFNGNVSGTFGMTITTMFPGAVTQDVLTLQGTVSGGNTITGTWNLTGTPGCKGNGNFTINKT
jgi:hypothetical protein